ncbi:MAG: sugar phosphate nucleotidyltransferase [Pseudomonadota bacterium]
MQTTDHQIIPAIMIGGIGSRLWPLSRSNRPKQFLKLVQGNGDQSLFQSTLSRFEDHSFGSPWLLTGSDFLPHVRHQMMELQATPGRVLIEPSMQGTAAALAAVAVAIAEEAPDAPVLAAPADHVINNPIRFRQTVQNALPLAVAGKIVTFGIVPTAPETGFGYIAPGPEVLDDDGGFLGYEVSAGGFREKPAKAVAEQFVATGCLWNAGIFLFTARTLMEELERHAPATLTAARRAVRRAQRTEWGGAARAETCVRLDPEAFATAPDDLAIDHAVMEHSDKVAVVPCDVGWSDIGSLSALWDVQAKDANQNVVQGDGMCVDSSGTLVVSGSGRKVVTSHVDDLMVIDTPDTVLILPRARAQSVKAIVGGLARANARQTAYADEAIFEWGSAQIVQRDDDALLLRLVVHDGATLAANARNATEQMWMVARGNAQVSLGTGNGHPPRLSVFGPGRSFKISSGENYVIDAEIDEVEFIVHNPLGANEFDETLDADYLKHLFAPVARATAQKRQAAEPFQAIAERRVP